MLWSRVRLWLSSRSGRKLRQNRMVLWSSIDGKVKFLSIYGCKWFLNVLYGSKYLYQIGYNRVLISFSLQPSWALLKTPVKSEQCIYPKDFYLSLKQFIKVHTIIIDCKLIVFDNHFVLLSFKCILKMYSQATLKRDWVWFYCWNAKNGAHKICVR